MAALTYRDDKILARNLLSYRRVGEEVAPLAPHRPERALLTHSVLHARVWFQVVYRWTILAAGRE